MNIKDKTSIMPGKKEVNSQARLGMFGGVFTPCVLTILGVIMFMRSGYVVGYAGIWATLAILTFAKLITTLTTLSISAIATNLEMRGGGVYFMISRVLGPDFGGSIGITLFAANTVGVAFYVIGFTEAFMYLLGLENVFIGRLISTVVITVLFMLTFKGADLVIKAQYVVLMILLLAVASMLIGGFIQYDSDVFAANVKPVKKLDLVFWPAFAIFFPAATGITAGANMSGDLKKPARSIPWGTLLAIFFTAAIYITQIILIGGSSGRRSLLDNGYLALQEMSFFAPLIIAGVFAATLSSALGSFLGGPRILQAMGHDRLMKSMIFFGKGSGVTNEPRRATVLTYLIAVGVIWAGDLNAVAEVISMFFLIAYGMINLSAFVESKSGNPSFRPTFRFFHWVTALIGALLCGVAMMKINDTYALIALGITGLIYFYLNKSNIKTSYGDAKRGYVFQKTKDNLLYLEGSKAHPKNWRPIMVALCDEPETEHSLVRAAGWLESGRGLLTVASIMARPNEHVDERIRLQKNREQEILRIARSEDVKAFAQCVVSDSYFTGLIDFMQSYSLGALKPNTILMPVPWKGSVEQMDEFYEKIEIAASFNYNLALLKPGDFALNKKQRRIDLWWRGEQNGSLMAIFAYLITLDATWSGSQIRFLRIINEEASRAKAEKQMLALKLSIRIPAEVCVIRADGTPGDIIAQESGDADLVFLGASATSKDEAKRWLENSNEMLTKLPNTILVWSNGEADIFA